MVLLWSVGICMYMTHWNLNKSSSPLPTNMFFLREHAHCSAAYMNSFLYQLITSSEFSGLSGQIRHHLPSYSWPRKCIYFQVMKKEFRFCLWAVECMFVRWGGVGVGEGRWVWRAWHTRENKCLIERISKGHLEKTQKNPKWAALSA